ncbi:hypothetical protein GCM10023079_50840 [Streptomyces chitinivorans]
MRRPAPGLSLVPRFPSRARTRNGSTKPAGASATRVPAASNKALPPYSVGVPIPPLGRPVPAPHSPPYRV